MYRNRRNIHTVAVPRVSFTRKTTTHDSMPLLFFLQIKMQKESMIRMIEDSKRNQKKAARLIRKVSSYYAPFPPSTAPLLPITSAKQHAMVNTIYIYTI